MDEEENQEELVNMKVCEGKGHQKLPVLRDEGVSAEEGGSDSEESVDSREGNEDEVEGGTVKTVVDAAPGVPLLQDLSSDDDAEKCPICLHSFQEQPVATPMGCQHHFCLDCILEWSKNVNSCPVDRIAFNGIQLRKCYGGKVQKIIAVQEPVKVEEEVNMDFDQTSCEVCGRSDREDRLLLCDGCDAGYHTECLTPPLDAVPVEEWFCPECTSNNPHTGSAEEASEDEVAALLTDAVRTTLHHRTSSGSRMRSIARTRQSERVRATVNRNRITQARGTQHVPRYLIQSTWLDETINAVLNSSACARKGRTGEKHRKSQRKKTSTETSSSSSNKNRTGRKDIKLHRGHLKSTEPGQKQAGKTDPASHSCITKSSATGKPNQTQPARPLGGRSKIRPASLAIFGDPLDLDPHDGESSEGGSVPLMDTSRRGLSYSALQSHQPVARPIEHGPLRCSLSMSEGDIKDLTPGPDLLGSILSGQSLLLMDSCSMVINRDGSLKLGKPVSMSSQAKTFGLETEVDVGTASGSKSNGDSESSKSFPLIPSSSHSFPGLISSNWKPATPLTPFIMTGSANICSSNLSPQRAPNTSSPRPVKSVGLSQKSWSKTSSSSSSIPLRHSNSMFDWASGGKGVDTKIGTGTVKKDPPKPVWLDVSRLPRIPKIRKGAHSSTSLQGMPWGEQGMAEAKRKRKQGRASTCTSSSSSFSPSTLKPSCASTGSSCNSGPSRTMCPTIPEGYITPLGSAESSLSMKQSWNVREPFHPMGSHLLGSDGIPEGNMLGHHAKGVMPKEKGAVPCISCCINNNADCQASPETIDSIQEKNKYNDNIKMGRLFHQNLPRERQTTIFNSRIDVANTDTEKYTSHIELSSQKHDSIFFHENNKSKPKGQHSGSRSCSAARGITSTDVRGKFKECMTGGLDGSQAGAETKRKSREATACGSHSRRRKRVRSSSESSLSESPGTSRRRGRCTLSYSSHRWSHSSNGDPSRSGIYSKRNHNRKGSDSQGFSQPRFRSRSRSRSRERRKGRVRSLSSCGLKDRSISKDGKRTRSTSPLRARKNEKDTLCSSHSTKSSLRINSTSASPTDMESNIKPISLKCPKYLTDQGEMVQSRHFPPCDVSEPQKWKTVKKVSLTCVNEEISAFGFHSDKGQSREENKETETKGKREIKPDLEKMSDNKLICLQSQVESSCQSQIPTEKKELFCKVTDSAGSISLPECVEESIPATDSEKRPRENSTEYAKHLSMDYTPNSLGVRRLDKAEVTGTSCNVEHTVITDTPETVGGMEAGMIKDTPETVGDMGATMITETPESLSKMGSTMITETPESVSDMGATMITETPESVSDMGAAMITETSESVCNMGSTMITETPESVADMEAAIITKTLDTIGDLGNLVIANSPDSCGDMDSTVITNTPKTVDDMENTVVTDISETVGDEENTVITDTPETSIDTGSSVITDPYEASGDTENTLIRDTPEISFDRESTVIRECSSTPKTVDGMKDAKIMDRPVVNQEAHHALKPAVIMDFSTISHRPMKRVPWSLQELDAPPVRPTMLSPNTLRQRGKDGLQKSASPSQVQGKEKWRLRERATEEVKLAIRPFFQKKEITKVEYKEIWGKAVQKICCSKSGEISPQRVASLVKAYVEKYKSVKKQQKDRQSQEVEETL